MMTTTTFDESNAGKPGPRWDRRGDRFGGWHGPHGFGFGPPLPVKLLGVLIAFLVFPPLGIIALAFLAWKSWQYRAYGNEAPFGTRGGGFGRGVRNTAFAEHVRKTMAGLRDEAEAFAAHEQSEREAKDRAAFEAFRAARANTDKGDQGTV